MSSLNRRSALKAGVAGSIGAAALSVIAAPAQASAVEVAAAPAIHPTLAALIDQAFAAANTVRVRPITVDFYSPLSAVNGFAQDAYINVVNRDKAATDQVLKFRIDLPKTAVTETATARWMTRALSSFGYVTEIESGVAGQKSYIWTVDRYLGGVNDNFRNDADMVFGFGDGLSRGGRIKNAIVVTPLTDGAPVLNKIVGETYAADANVVAYYESARSTWRAAGYGYKYGFKSYPGTAITSIAWGESVDSRVAKNDAPSLLSYDHDGIY